MVAYDICDENCEKCLVKDICEKTANNYKEWIDEEVKIIRKNSQGASPLKFNGLNWPIVIYSDKKWTLTVQVDKVKINLIGDSKEDVISIWNKINKTNR